MSLYSTIERRMWGDEKFRALSKPQPNARDLWVYLLTGPHNSSMPGLFVFGEAAMAEAMEWPVAATRRCFGEIVAAGMAKFDPATRLVWLPKGLRHNPPKNPNVIVGWRRHWDVLPECELRDEAERFLLAALRESNPSFGEAFEVVLGIRPPKPSSNPSGQGKANGLPNGSVDGSPIKPGNDPPKTRTGTRTGTRQKDLLGTAPPPERLPFSIADLIAEIKTAAPKRAAFDPFDSGLAAPITAVIKELHRLGCTLADVRIAALDMDATWPGDAMITAHWLATKGKLTSAIAAAKQRVAMPPTDEYTRVEVANGTR